MADVHFGIAGRGAQRRKEDSNGRQRQQGGRHDQDASRFHGGLRGRCVLARTNRCCDEAHSRLVCTRITIAVFHCFPAKTKIPGSLSSLGSLPQQQPNNPTQDGLRLPCADRWESNEARAALGPGGRLRRTTCLSDRRSALRGMVDPGTGRPGQRGRGQRGAASMRQVTRWFPLGSFHGTQHSLFADVERHRDRLPGPASSSPVQAHRSTPSAPASAGALVFAPRAPAAPPRSKRKACAPR
jgi:hypothetical protein